MSGRGGETVPAVVCVLVSVVSVGSMSAEWLLFLVGV
jgi:hypothetical protein